MPTYQSLSIVSPPTDQSATGVPVLDLGPRGLTLYPPAAMSSGGLQMATQIPIEMVVVTAPAAGGYYITTIRNGIWQVQAVAFSVGTVGGAGCTVDVQACPQATAANAGTTQLTAPLVLSAGAGTDVVGTLIASPTLLAPGTRLSAVYAGTVTGLVGVLTVFLGRVS